MEKLYNILVLPYTRHGYVRASGWPIYFDKLDTAQHRLTTPYRLWLLMSQFDRIAQPDGLGVREEAGNRLAFLSGVRAPT